MESKQSKVRCPHCSVEFSFDLPQKYVERPSKSLKFKCEYCTEQFSTLVADLFSEDGTELASLKIRHQSINGLLLHSSWEELIQSHFEQAIDESDPISAFGKDWKPASMYPELSVIFPNAQVLEPERDESSDEDSGAVVEVEEEPSYENDLFMDKPLEEPPLEEPPLEEPPWNEEPEDPFDIPISNIEDELQNEEENELVDLLADGAMDIFLEDSDEEEPVIVDEDSGDPFLAISDEIEIQKDHSIDALISTLDQELEERELIGTNTLDLLQSESDEEEPVPYQEPQEEQKEPSSIDEESLEAEPFAVETDHTDEDLETMKTMIDSSPFDRFGLDGDESIQNADESDEEDVILATATVVEEDSDEPLLEQEKTIISKAPWIQEETLSENNTFSKDTTADNNSEADGEDLSFFTPDSWEEEEIDESKSGSESIDYDQTEEEESQSSLNPAFQISTKKVVRKQYRAVIGVFALTLIAAVAAVRYSSLSEVSSFFMPIEDTEIQNVSSTKATKQSKVESKKTKTEVQTSTEKVEKTVDEAAKAETKEPPKEEVASKKPEEKKSMLAVASNKEAFLDDKPLSKNKKQRKVVPPKRIPKLPPMDPKRATREGWIKLEDKSYESAKAIFEDVIKNEPTPEAFLGLGYAEERMAERYKDRKDFIRVEAHYDQAHKYYCEAMEYYVREDIIKEELQFDIRYLQARLKVISRACS